MFNNLNKDEEKIILKSRELFSTYGIRSVSMDDISTGLGISKKTLYRFVKDKEDLVYKVVTYNFNTNIKLINNLLKPDFNAIDELLVMAEFFTKLYKSHPANMIFDLQKFYPSVYQNFKEKRTEKLLAFYKSNLKKGIEEGLYRKNMDQDSLLKIIILLSDTIIENNKITIQETKSHTFIMEFYKFHLFGIVSEKGYQYLQNELENIK